MRLTLLLEDDTSRVTVHATVELNPQQFDVPVKQLAHLYGEPMLNAVKTRWKQRLGFDAPNGAATQQQPEAA